MKINSLNTGKCNWQQIALHLAAIAAVLTGQADAGAWTHDAWTNDADSGITGVQADYTVAVNTGTAGDPSVAVNGITFETHATSGANFSMGGAFAATGRAANVSGASSTLATNFLYNGNPRTVTLTNLVVGEAYETTFFAFAWDASGRVQTFASGGDSYVVDQDFYGLNNGIRISYNFVATANTRAFTITPGAGGTFHMSALANRRVPIPPATITLFGTNVAGSSAVISPVAGNAGTINWTVPFGTDVAALAPTFSLYSLAATCDRTSGAVPSPDFSSGPVAYTVTDGGTTNVYTVTANLGPASTARDITGFNANFPGTSSVITSTGPDTGTIEVVLPYGTPEVLAASLAPTFTLSPGATCSQVSGIRPTPNLGTAGAVTYSVTAEDSVSIKDYSVTVRVTGWKYSSWTGDADSGIGGDPADYTVAVNTGTAGDLAVTVNGIPFETDSAAGANFTIGGAIAATGRATNVAGDSATLANNFIYNASPRTVTLSNLIPGETYEASLFSYGWDASGRTQTFAANGDAIVADQDAFGNNNGIRISYTFVSSSTTQDLTITQVPGGAGTFHMSALANRRVHPPTDTDGDELPDVWEMEKAGNLTDLTGLLSGPGPGAGSGNYDGDSLSDAVEYALSGLYPILNPKAADTDSDGLEDGAEIFPTAPRVPTNPTVADSDGDGLNDFVESNSGIYVDAGNPGTNPNSVDSDGDQYPDFYEIVHGGNPVLATSIPMILPSGISLGVVTDEASTGISPSETYSHKISGGSAATINGVDLDVLDPATTPANFDWNGNAGGKNLIGPAINNGTWNPAVGNVTGAGNLQMFGTFTYSGGGGTPGNSQQFTLSNLEVGLAYELRIFVRKWDDGTVRPEYLKFTNGAEVTDFYILEDRPGTVLANGNNESAYYISFTYVARSTTLTIDATVANVSSASGSFHMYGMTNRTAGLPKPVEIESITRVADGSSVTLTISSRFGRAYAVDFSLNLIDWLELTDNVPSEGAQTTYVDTVASNFQEAFYRVRDVTP